MDTQTSEQALRYEAVLRRALGHRVCDICRDLERSPRWLNKWWREFKGVSHLIYGFLTGRGQHPKQRGHLARRLPELAIHLGRLEQNYHNHMILIAFMPFLRRSSGTHPKIMADAPLKLAA